MAKSTICLIEGCGKRPVGRGWCSKHYQRWKATGDPLGTITAPNGDRAAWLMAQTKFDGPDCLLIPFKRRSDGYGIVCIEGIAGIRAHRWMCEHVNGPAPVDKPHALHSCGKGHLGCVHPRHLYWGSSQENQEDRLKHGTDNRGEKHPLGKLTVSAVRDIRSLSRKEVDQRSLAEKYGVKRGAISAVRSGQTWAWLNE